MTETTKSKKAFKKGDRVTLIRSWDGRGTAYYNQAIVHSCGLKRLILTDEETGKELGRDFPPLNAADDPVPLGLSNSNVYHRLEGAALVAVGEELAKAEVERAREAFEKAIETYPDDHGYCRVMARKLARLHEPRIFSESECSEGMKAYQRYLRPGADLFDHRV